MVDRNIDYSKVLEVIRLKVKRYLIENAIDTIVCGISGGLDSGLNMAIISPVCEELGVNLIGRYIFIESNKKEEELRADLVAQAFCKNYKKVDLTELFKLSSAEIDKNEEAISGDDSHSYKIRMGNIKARLRMIYLYNLASKNRGLVLDNDNMTERELGFWTLNGDVGDLTPLSSLFKTEVFELARYMAKNTENKVEKVVLDSLISAVPTDGLGITNSDVEQFGVSSYDEVDDILMSLIPLDEFGDGFDGTRDKNEFNEEYYRLCNLYTPQAVSKVWNRHLGSRFKRNWPNRLMFNVDKDKIDEDINDEIETINSFDKFVFGG